MRNEIKIKSSLLKVLGALQKADFQLSNKLQSEIIDFIINDKKYRSDFLNVYLETKNHVNKQFHNVCEDIIIKSGVYSREELSNKK